MTVQTSGSAAGPGGRFGNAPWWVLLIEGVALIVLAVLAVLAPFIASLAVTTIVGWIYMFAGGIRIVSSLTHRGHAWGWSLLIGALALLAGLFLLLWPLAGLVTLTIVLGAYFFADAIASFVLAATLGRHAGRGLWLIVTGVADLILSAIMVMGLAHGAFWLLGLVVAVNLVFLGASLVTVALTWRVRPQDA